MALATDVPAKEAQIVNAAGQSTELMFIWMSLLSDLLRDGFTGTITTAALTGGGVQGSMTFRNGILVSQVQAT